MKLVRRVTMAVAVAVVGVAGIPLARGGDGGVGDGARGCASGECGVKAATGDKAKCAVAEKNAVLNTVSLAALLRAKTPVTLLDARSGKWDDGKRIPGAKAVNAESTAAEIEAAAPDKGGLIVTYCSNLKCPASAKLAERLRKDGYSNVVEYPEGIAGWIDAGHDVTETKP